jgi:hypothetical protein
LKQFSRLGTEELLRKHLKALSPKDPIIVQVNRTLALLKQNDIIPLPSAALTLTSPLRTEDCSIAINIVEMTLAQTRHVWLHVHCHGLSMLSLT